MTKTHILAALTASTILATQALAGPPPAPAPAPQSDWEFRIGLPLWGGVPYSGDVETGGIATSVDVSVSDILKRIDMAAALSFEARHGRWAFLADALYLRLSDSVDPRGRFINSARIEIEQTLVNLAVSYRIVDEQAWKLDASLGARYNRIGLEFDVDFAPGRVGDRHVDGSESWVDPIIGLQLRAKVCSPVTFVAKGDVGGFGVGSDLTWQVYGGFEFQLSSNIWAGLGWRHLHTDYSDGGFNYDVSTTGPVLEFGVNF